MMINGAHRRRCEINSALTMAPVAPDASRRSAHCLHMTIISRHDLPVSGNGAVNADGSGNGAISSKDESRPISTREKSEDVSDSLQIVEGEFLWLVQPDELMTQSAYRGMGRQIVTSLTAKSSYDRQSVASQLPRRPFRRYTVSGNRPSERTLPHHVIAGNPP